MIQNLDSSDNQYKETSDDNNEALELTEKDNMVSWVRLHELNPFKYSQDDIGLSYLFADFCKDRFRYNTTVKEWYFYNGKIWQEDKGGMNIARCAKIFTKALLHYAIKEMTVDDQRKNYIKLINKLNSAGAREILIRDSRERHCISKNDLDSNIDLFNCQNCTINLKTYEINHHNPNDMLSKISNVYYNPYEKNKIAENFINQIMQGDKEKFRYLQKILGYSLTGDTKHETCFILFGATTRNGKSTLVETFAYMLGNTKGYAMTIRPETLATKQNNDSRQANDDIARLDGCRFLNAAEPPKRMIFDTGLFKNLLGRDLITARHLHQSFFEFVPIFKLFMNTNFLPLITDDTLFTSGRINVVTFNRHFAPNEQDHNLKDKLKETPNISSFFNWCFEGLRAYQKEGIEPPLSVKTSTAEYRAESDKVGNFVNEILVRAKTNIKAERVYESYKNWCIDNGMGQENKKNFYAELKTKGLLSETGTICSKTERNVIKGYELKPKTISFKQCEIKSKSV